LILVYLTSGLFLGWSLGANDASNVFGTAVGTRMVSFYRAAIIAAIFVILGAVIHGNNTAATLDALGKVTSLPGAFTISLASALTVFTMTKYAIPVSTSQAIIGAIVGWNLFSGHSTDYTLLRNIALTWVSSPILGALFAIILYLSLKLITSWAHIHLLRLDSIIRAGLIITGAFGAYSLGANNIGNVMGVYVEALPLKDINIAGLLTVTGSQQLFLVGGFAIAAGILTYSRRMMMTVGRNLLQMSAEAAIVVVFAQAMVLFVFSSQFLLHAWMNAGLPAYPLVPVSSTQAVIGAILGIGLLKGGRGIRYNILGPIAAAWIVTPLISAMMTFFLLYVMGNVLGLM
jgi:PiT family inorganic phosphate transporter